MSPRYISIDTETYYYGKSGCSVRSLGASAYTRHPEFYCYLISVYDGEEVWVGAPEDFDWSCLEGAHLLSHNANFDRTVIEHMIRIGQIPAFKWAQWDCTADLTAYVCGRRALADAALFLYGETVSKDARANMDGVHWRDIKDGPQGQEFLKYADGDARYCHRFWTTHGHFWPEHEREISRVQREAGIRGVQVDVDKLNAYIEGMGKVLFSIEQKLPWVADGERPTGKKIIAEMCRKAGIPGTPVKSRDGEEAYLEWEKTYAPLHPWISAVSQWRVANKFKGFLETIKERLDADGIFHFSLKYYGAHTGRFSGDAGVNLQNLRKDPILIDKDGNLRTDDASTKEYWDLRDKGEVPDWLDLTNWGLLNDDGTPMEAVFEHSYDTRSLFIARPGCKLVMSDLSQIEPRVLAWLAGHEKMLAAIRDGYSVYEAAAVATGKYTGKKGDFKKLKDLYKVQKAQTLGLGYGCGWEKYITVALTLAGYDVCKLDPIDPETGLPIYGFTARKDVTEFRMQNPEIASFDQHNPGIWAKLDNAFRESLGSDFVLDLPSGRQMVYRRVARSAKKKAKNIYDEKTGQLIKTIIEERYVFTADVGGHRSEFYGGLLTENATQAAAYDVFAHEVLRVESFLRSLRAIGKSAHLLWTVHDECIVEVPLDLDAKIIETLMTDTPPWLPGCPIGAEASEGPCYKK